MSTTKNGNFISCANSAVMHLEEFPDFKLKHPSFAGEDDWRIVTQAVSATDFRSGISPGKLLPMANPTIVELTGAVGSKARNRPEAMRLMTHPGVGSD